MVGGFFALLLSGGWLGIKFSEKTKTLLRVLGLTFFSLGLLWTFLIALLQTWDSYPLLMEAIQKNISENVSQTIFIISTPVFMLAFGVIGFLAIFTTISMKQLNIQKIEKGYKLQLDPVIDLSDATVLVENIGTGEVTFSARLIKVLWRPIYKNKGKPKELDINKINPRGLFLGWGQASRNFEKLQERTPTFVQLMTTDRRDLSFVFADHVLSKTLDSGYYTIQVEFRRWNGIKYVDFSTFEETLKVDGDLEWIKKRGLNGKPREKTKRESKKRSLH